MGYISQDTLRDIQQSSDIVDYIGQYVALKKQGRDYLGLCPFHGEKTPSFHVSPEKKVFHCFGCGRSGNIFQFAQGYNHLSFIDAVKDVAQFSHIHLDDWQEDEAHTDIHVVEKQHLMQLHKKAAAVYHHLLLHTEEGKEALRYLENRGMTRDDIETFQLGYAPQRPGVDVLVEVLKKEGLTEKDYEASGLFVVDQYGQPHDRFLNRIMIPIHNPYGRVIAFSGRVMTSEQPKYLNSKDTLIFNKSDVLFHFDRARDVMRHKKRIILSEGYMDVIALHRAGLDEAVASMGTSLTTEQIHQFAKSHPQVIISYDGDKAGMTATHRAITLLEEQGLTDIRVALFPNNMDPDEYGRTYGNEALHRVYDEGTLSKIEFMLRYLGRDKNLQQDRDKTAYVEQALQFLSQQSSLVEVDIYLKQLASALNISEAILYERLNEYRQQQVQQPQWKTAPSTPKVVAPIVEERPKISPTEHAEQWLIKRSFYFPEARHILREEQFSFPDPAYEALYIVMEDYCNTHYDEVTEEEFYNWLETDEERQLFYNAMLITMKPELTNKEIYDCIWQIQRQTLDHLIHEKQRQLTEASQMGNIEKSRELSKEVVELLKMRREGDKQDGTKQR